MDIPMIPKMELGEKKNGVKKLSKKGKKDAFDLRVKKKPGRKANKFTKTGRRRQRRDPDAPKRARTAFNFFLMEFRQKYLVRSAVFCFFFHKDSETRTPKKKTKLTLTLTLI